MQLERDIIQTNAITANHNHNSQSQEPVLVQQNETSFLGPDGHDKAFQKK